MKKICIVTTSISKGGAERFSAVLSQMLFSLSYDIHVLSTKNDIDFEFFGTLFCLEVELGGSKSVLKKAHILKSYFKKNNFDIIIDNRTRPIFIKEYLIYKYIFKAQKTISIVHSYYLKRYLPSSVFLTKLLYNDTTIIAVSKEIENLIVKTYRLKNCEQIYNPVDIAGIVKSSNKDFEINDTYILFFGRIDEKVKNLTLLLKAYKKSKLPDNGIKLYLLGDGNDIPIIKEAITRLLLEPYVKHIQYLQNPFPYVKKAFFTTLTSRHEGFPMSMIESLACGTPVVSVDCKSGPKEIIKHGYNGLLVENHNISALAKAFNRFIEDDLLYQACKKNAKASVYQFSIEKITKNWYNLLNK